MYVNGTFCSHLEDNRCNLVCLSLLVEEINCIYWGSEFL